MEKQMRAEREKRANIANSEGDMQARINRAEGEKQELIARSEGEKMRRINEAEGSAAEIEAVAIATAEISRELRPASGEGPGENLATDVAFWAAVDSKLKVGVYDGSAFQSAEEYLVGRLLEVLLQLGQGNVLEEADGVVVAVGVGDVAAALEFALVPLARDDETGSGSARTEGEEAAAKPEISKTL